MRPVVIFDLDGTLYKPFPEVEQVLYAHWIDTITKKNNVSENEAKNIYKTLKAKYKSSTQVMHYLGFGETTDILKRGEEAYMPTLLNYLKKDKQLKKILSDIAKKKTLVLLSNTTTPSIEKKIQALGLEGVFDRYFSSADTGLTKPDSKAYKQILVYYDIAPNSRIAIGDRVLVDLAPARRLGMKTIYISWGKELAAGEKEYVDETLLSIYDVQNIL